MCVFVCVCVYSLAFFDHSSFNRLLREPYALVIPSGTRCKDKPRSINEEVTDAGEGFVTVCAYVYIANSEWRYYSVNTVDALGIGATTCKDVKQHGGYDLSSTTISGNANQGTHNNNLRGC